MLMAHDVTTCRKRWERVHKDIQEERAKLDVLMATCPLPSSRLLVPSSRLLSPVARSASAAFLPLLELPLPPSPEARRAIHDMQSWTTSPYSERDMPPSHVSSLQQSPLLEGVEALLREREELLLKPGPVLSGSQSLPALRSPSMAGQPPRFSPGARASAEDPLCPRDAEVSSFGFSIYQPPSPLPSAADGRLLLRRASSERTLAAASPPRRALGRQQPPARAGRQLVTPSHAQRSSLGLASREGKKYFMEADRRASRPPLLPAALAAADAHDAYAHAAWRLAEAPRMAPPPK